jgi:hypothetical protein
MSSINNATPTQVPNDNITANQPLNNDENLRLLSQLPFNGKCFETNETGIFLSNEYTCAPGFYCPFANPSIPESLPQACIPSLQCHFDRLQSFPCQAQGAFEPGIATYYSHPVVCGPGFYCPDSRTALPCPDGKILPLTPRFLLPDRNT